jgi:ABC-type transport system substrate-binding protein
VLTRNPHYYGFDQNKQRLPYLDELVFLIVPDQDAADLKFRSESSTDSTTSSPRTIAGTKSTRRTAITRCLTLARGEQQLLLVQPQQSPAALAGQTAPAGKRIGDSFVDPAKVRMVQQSRLSRAVSMASIATR